MSLEGTHETDAGISVLDASQANIDVNAASAGLGPEAGALLPVLPHKKRALSEGGADLSKHEGESNEKAEKRTRRLVKNREAAQQFRHRQKQHILDMEAKIKLLDTENQELRNKVELLASENKIVKDQLMYLRSFIGQAVSISMDKLPSNGAQAILGKEGEQ